MVWGWMPPTVLALGLLSIAMLICVDQMNQRQRTEFARCDEIMHIRIEAAMSHLWLDEDLHARGEPMERGWSHLREAKRRSEALLNGGQTDYGLVMPPLAEPALRRRVENIQRILTDFEALARERYANEDAARDSVLEKRMDAVFIELQNTAVDLDKLLETDLASSYVRSRRLFYGIFAAWSLIVIGSTVGLWHREWKRRHAEQALHAAKGQLETRVAETTKMLRILNAEIRSELSEHIMIGQALKESEEHLRQLSARLLTTQEAERRRIATELHDGFGHSLILMKLRLGFIENELRKDPSGASDGCRNLSRLIDMVIEDVRRLSRDLRPSVLEELGLSAALGWLVDNCIRHDHTMVTSALVDVDPLVAPEAQVVLYRIVQEALTNAAKHAKATEVSVRADRHGDRLFFVVEDNGGGFDVREAMTREASARGLGLATMHERARMIGGALNIWSERGKGTRIAFDVPIWTQEN